MKMRMKQFLLLLCLIVGHIAAEPVEMEVDMEEDYDVSDGGGDDGMEEDEGDPGEEYVDEIRDQVEEGNNNDTDEDRDKRQTYSNGVSHGDIVAYQHLYSKLYWVSCRYSYCSKHRCPKLYMEGNDWSNCWGEVYKIYRSRGRGYVRVGDVVGIYFPYHRKWFSMRGGYGHKSICPGRYSYAHGFSHRQKWYQCHGEVYKIYAKGKRVGDVIYRYDDIMLYYVYGNKYVNLSHRSRIDLSSCPGNYRPPPSRKYDDCYGQVCQLWKR